MAEIPTVLFYTSFLVLAIQLIALSAILVISIQPPGLWFLLGCIAILGYMFAHTAVIVPLDMNKKSHIFPVEPAKIN